MSGLCIALAVLAAVLAASLGSTVSQIRKERKRFNSLNRQYHTFYQRFKNIIDVEEAHAHLSKLFNLERARAKGIMLDLKRKHDQMLKAHENNKNELHAETERIVHAVDALKGELAELTERGQHYEVGFYKPRYIFESSEAYKRKLDEIRNNQKTLLDNQNAAVCHTDSTLQVDTKDSSPSILKLVLRAFNGECDAAIAKVDAKNIITMERRINKAFEAINMLARFKHVEITYEYLRLKLNELYLTHEFHCKQEEEKEEQRRIREQISEEERIKNELKKAVDDVAHQEKRLRESLSKAQQSAVSTGKEEMDAFQDKIERIQHELDQAQLEKQQTELRLTQFTAGHVYILSNVGSFGENIFKIGMTRQLNPVDYIKQLGDSAVPFPFDVHALIYSDTAEELLADIQESLASKRINLVTNDSEFYQVKIDEIERIIQKHYIDLDIKRVADASDYRRSLAMKDEVVPEEEESIIAPIEVSPVEVAPPRVLMEWVHN